MPLSVSLFCLASPDTNFSYSKAVIPKTVSPTGKLEISVTVSNTGKLDGPFGSASPPNVLCFEPGAIVG